MLHEYTRKHLSMLAFKYKLNFIGTELMEYIHMQCKFCITFLVINFATICKPLFLKVIANMVKFF